MPLQPWHITFTTYGSRLHGDPRPTVALPKNRPGDPFIPEDARLLEKRRQSQKHVTVLLTDDECRHLERMTLLIAAKAGWTCHVVACLPNHIHSLLGIPESLHGETARGWLKRWLTLELRDYSNRKPPVWTKGGSNRLIHSYQYLEAAHRYILAQASQDPRRMPR